MLPTKKELTKLTLKIRILTVLGLIIGIINGIPEIQFLAIISFYIVTSIIFYSVKKFKINQEFISTEKIQLQTERNI